ILRRHAQGWHVIRIAAELGMSRRGVEAVLERLLPLRMPDTQTTDVDELLMVIREGYERDIEDLGDFIVDDVSPRQKLSAIKARMEARGRCLDLLAEFGFVTRTEAK